MRRGRSLPLAAALLSVLALGATAAALESTPMASSGSPAPAGDGPGSILGVLQLLLAALLELLGLEAATAGVAGAADLHGLFVAVLRTLRTYVVPLLAAGAVVALAVLVGRRVPGSVVWSRTGLIARPSMLLGRRRGDEATASRSESTSWPPAEPDDDVSSTWVAMTERVDFDRPRARTPAEWAAAAVRTGLDEDAVDELTETFRSVRYGGTDETPDRRRRARRVRDRIEGESDRDRTEDGTGRGRAAETGRGRAADDGGRDRPGDGAE